MEIFNDFGLTNNNENELEQMAKELLEDNIEFFGGDGTVEDARIEEYLNEWQCCLDNINASVIVSDYSTHK